MSGPTGNATGYLEERQHTLERVQERINSLESRLIAERNSREAILKDITAIHFLRNPFSRLSQDTLSSIFKAWDDDPSLRNRRLCLVCKAWYHIVWNSTSFWTDIILRPDPHTSRFSALCRFAKLCSERSIDKPLNVVIDLSAIVWYNIHIGKTLDKSVEAFSFLPPDIVPHFASDAEWDLEHPHERVPEYPYSPYYEGIPQIFMRQLMDQSDDLCQRWRSLHLILPKYSGTVHKILHEMTGDMGQLVQIDIGGSAVCGNSQKANDAKPLPHFPRLQSLTTTQDFSINRISIDHTQMNHLRLINHNSSWHFLHVAESNFSALLTLELFIKMVEVRSFNPAGPVFLPQLTSLTLRGRASSVERYVLLFNAPNLERLHIDQKHYHHSLTAVIAPFFKTIKSMLIEGCASSSRKKGARLVVVLSYEALSIILRNTPALVSLRIKEDDWGTDAENLAAIQAVRDEGYPLLFLKEVISVDESSDFLMEDPSHLSVMHVPFGDIPVLKETK